jgi:hypothetical protein
MDKSASLMIGIKTPTFLVWLQCFAFVVLYSVWILPEVVGIRNTALFIGAVIGLYVIYQNRCLLLKQRALPIWFILCLFIWATIHLFFVGQDFAAQLKEYVRIWRYAGIGFIFALGLGLSLVNSQNQKQWYLIYFGLCIPAAIFLVKYVLTTYGEGLGLSVPASLLTYQSSAPFYIPKSDYIPFCLPALAIALGEIKHILHSRQEGTPNSFLKMAGFLLVITATLFLFYAQTMKNGFLYALLCAIVFAGFILFERSHKSVKQRLLLAGAGLLIAGAVMYTHIQQNTPWKALMADAKIAVQLDQYDHWKYNERKGLPKNEAGQKVFGTNYQRIAWGIAGAQLSFETPLGYGLIEDSFSRLAKEKWPDSVDLSHTHSGWLDLALAFGIPGLALILITILVLMKQSVGVVYPWGDFVFWSLLSILFLWVTTEAAQTVTFAALIFWIGLCSGLTLHTSGVSDSLVGRAA